jgi:hypothetical protein
LRIPNWLSEAASRRSSDNTMAKRKRIKGQTYIYKTLDRKLPQTVLKIGIIKKKSQKKLF